METAAIQTNIEKTISELTKKGSPNAHLTEDINNVKVDLEFMIENSKIWVLSHHDRTKMRIEDLDNYLNTL